LISGESSRLLDPDQVELLAQHRMIKPLLRQMVIAELAAQVPIPDEAGAQALTAFMQEQGIENEEQLNTFLCLNLLRRQELEQQLIQPLRLQRFVADRFLPKAEARFLQRKTQLDRVVYSLLRLEDAGLARELYLRINEGESDFAELAARYAEGPERTTRGVVGPVPLMQAHPVLAERLRTATPGVLMEPFRIEKWWLVVRLETYSPATLDEDTAQQMARELFEEYVEEAVQLRINDLISLRFPEA
jgi:parvulin-like peptidyl-prolyl isomerase